MYTSNSSVRLILVAFLFLAFSRVSYASNLLTSEAEARLVANNFIHYLSDNKVEDANNLQVGEIVDLKDEYKNTYAYLATFYPYGYAIIPATRYLLPIYAYSIDRSVVLKYTDKLRDILPTYIINSYYYDIVSCGGKIDSLVSIGFDSQSIDKALSLWDAYTQSSYYNFITTLRTNDLDEYIPGGDLFTSTRLDGSTTTINWDQRSPYNNDCDLVDDGTGTFVPAAVGCVALSMAQVMWYYEWPNTYDWDHMVDDYWLSGIDIDATDSVSISYVDAVASLCHEVGERIGTTYGYDQSTAPTDSVYATLRSVYGYSNVVSSGTWSYLHLPQLWTWVTHDIDAYMPIIFIYKATNTWQGISTRQYHSVVVTGYQTVSGIRQMLLHWGGVGSGYGPIGYTCLDGNHPILHHFTSVVVDHNIVPDNSSPRKIRDLKAVPSTDQNSVVLSWKHLRPWWYGEFRSYDIYKSVGVDGPISYVQSTRFVESTSIPGDSYESLDSISYYVAAIGWSVPLSPPVRIKMLNGTELRQAPIYTETPISAIQTVNNTQNATDILYITYLHPSGSNPNDVYFTKSIDGGDTWYPPIKLSNGVGLNYQPKMAFGKDTNFPHDNKIAITWKYNDADGDKLITRFINTTNNTLDPGSRIHSDTDIGSYDVFFRKGKTYIVYAKDGVNGLHSDLYCYDLYSETGSILSTENAAIDNIAAKTDDNFTYAYIAYSVDKDIFCDRFGPSNSPHYGGIVYDYSESGNQFLSVQSSTIEVWSSGLPSIAFSVLYDFRDSRIFIYDMDESSSWVRTGTIHDPFCSDTNPVFVRHGISGNIQGVSHGIIWKQFDFSYLQPNILATWPDGTGRWDTNEHIPKLYGATCPCVPFYNPNSNPYLIASTVIDGNDFNGLVTQVYNADTVAPKRIPKHDFYPKEITVGAISPNPFNSYVKIGYKVNNGSKMLINIYNIEGRIVKTLVNRRQRVGDYKVTWNASNNASGLYFIQFKSDKMSITRKIILIK